MKKFNKVKNPLSATGIVADVDCTAEDSKQLCEANGVEGYPTLKYGDPVDLQTYEGGRTYKELMKFAKANLAAPPCGPLHMVRGLFTPKV
jgi:hypothetical protein